MNAFIGRVISLLTVLIVTSSDIWAQCAMCRGSVESSLGNGRNNVGIGLNFGIAYLFVVPYLTVAVIAFMWYRKSKKIQRERELILARVHQAMNSNQS